MGITEKERAMQLKILVTRSGLNVEKMLNEDFGAYVIHSGSTIIVGNQALADLIGYPVDELTGLNAWKLFAPESTPIIKQKLLEKSEEAYEVVARRKDGSTLKVQLKGINRELSGEPVRIVLVKLLDNRPA